VAEPVRDTTWVFGYGSLVSSESMARTIGRVVEPHEGWLAAHLHGFGRRWNYGSKRQRADWHAPHGFVESGVVVCLGIEAAAGERCNGVVVRVSDEELAALDRRESDYERTDVSDLVAIERGAVDGRVVTYVPRPSAIERYLTARLERRAAVRRSYVDLVRDAFHRLGEHHLDEYTRATPDPDVPIVDTA
jgi:cation transport regulator ChaC